MELAEIFRRYGAQYRARFGARMLPSHLRALHDIEACRTQRLGGQVYFCEPCQQFVYAYHSCNNRHCPKCQNERAQAWLAQQRALLLPVPHFLVTFTLPSELRALARSHQRTVYNLLFQTAAQALQTLAQDPRFAGGEIGLIGVLHTWKRDMDFHPHVHFLVPGGALSADHSTWLPVREDFLVPATALSPIFRAKFRDALRLHPALFNSVPKAAWDKDWVVHLKAVGAGQHALAYLARYVFRVALCNSRLVRLENDHLTFSYREAKTQRTRFCTLPALSFISRFLQHVLPKGFIKVRYYGLFCPAKRKLLAVVRYLLRAATPAPASSLALALPPRCPTCGAPLTLHKTLPPQPHAPPPLRLPLATTFVAAHRAATA
jgi:hypothetical protein